MRVTEVSSLFGLLVSALILVSYNEDLMLVVYIAFALVCFAQLILFSKIFNNQKVNSLTFFFLFSFWAYSFLGPIEYLLGFPSIMYEYYSFTGEFFIFHLTTIFISMCAIYVAICVFRSRAFASPQQEFEWREWLNEYRNFGLFLVFFGLLNEAINFHHAGGLQALLQGKAVFYREYSRGFTLPSYVFIGIGSFLYLAAGNGRVKSIVVLMVVLWPVFFELLLLGERSALFTVGLPMFLALVLRKSIKFSIFTTIALLCLYLVIAFVYSVRAYVPWIFDSEYGFGAFLTMVNKENFLRSVLPGNAEFGSSPGNMSVYFSDQLPRLYGSSYANLIFRPFPTWFFKETFFPSGKPIGINDVYLEAYFPELKSQGKGTGFSAALEGYWNLGLLGVFIHYFLLMTFFAVIDAYVDRRKKSILSLMLYAGSITWAIKIHRSPMEALITLTIHIVILICPLLLIWSFLCKVRKKTKPV